MLAKCSRYFDRHVVIVLTRPKSCRLHGVSRRTRSITTLKCLSSTSIPLHRKDVRPRIAYRSERHRTVTTSSAQHDFAVLGGGITGLANAWYLTQEFPDSKVTIYEQKADFGGWLKSKVVDVGDGEVIFEQGPRSLRPQGPNGFVAVRLAEALNLESELLATSASSPAAKNRFVYYPDHLVKMPGPGQNLVEILSSFWREPIFTGLTRGALSDLRARPRPTDLSDESVGSFIARRFNEGIANNIASALFHGIYAGDIWQLSARSLIPMPWTFEARYGGVLWGAIDGIANQQAWNFCDDVELQMQMQEKPWEHSLRMKMIDCSVFTFRKGLQTLSDKLIERLSQNKNVTLRPHTTVKNFSSRSNPALRLRITVCDAQDNTQAQSHFDHSHIISTIASPTLASIIKNTPNPNKREVEHINLIASRLGQTPAVNVAVVNLYFRTPNLLQNITPPGGMPRNLQNGLQGFGYLIPQSVPYDQNPESALGVIFDSDISPNLWTSVPDDRLGTKLTVMLGGHWWDSFSSPPTESECEQMARDVLARHLGIEEFPAAINVSIQQQCIPQYTVGHEDRLSAAHQTLSDLYGGRVKVAGSWYTGVGVNDCLRSAYELVQNLKKPDAARRTGLERFHNGRPMALVRRKPGELEIVKVDAKAAELGYFKAFQNRK